MPDKRASNSADFESPDSSNIPNDVWTISAKIRGIGELIRSFNKELPLESEEAYMGIGAILVGLADELNDVRDEFEGRSYRPTRKMPEDFYGDDRKDR